MINKTVILLLFGCLAGIRGQERSGWAGYEEHAGLRGWLKFHAAPAAWRAAAAACLGEDAQLASPWSRAFTAAVSSLQARHGAPVVHFGTKEIGEPVLFQSRSDLVRGERCGVLFANGTKGETPCDRRLSFICYAAVPTAPPVDSASPSPTSTPASASTPAPTSTPASASTPSPTSTPASASTPSPTSTPASASTPSPTSTPASASTPAPTSTPASASTPAPTSTPASASTPAPTSTPASASTPAPTSTRASASTPAPTSTPASASTPAPSSTPASASTPAPTSTPAFASTPSPISNPSTVPTSAPPTAPITTPQLRSKITTTTTTTTKEEESITVPTTAPTVTRITNTPALTSAATSEPETSPPQTPAPESTICRDMGLDAGYEWTEVTGECYKFHGDVANWTAANATCAAEGARFGVPGSYEEAQLFARLLKANLDNIIGPPNIFKGAVLVGIYYENGIWITVDGMPLEETGYSKWWPGWPFYEEQRPRAYLEHTGRLENTYDQVARAFICEAAPPPAPPVSKD